MFNHLSKTTLPYYLLKARFSAGSLSLNEPASFIQRLLQEGFLTELQVRRIRTLHAENHFEHKNIYALITGKHLTYGQLMSLALAREYNNEGLVVADFCRGVHLADLKNIHVCKLIQDGVITADDVINRDGEHPSIFRNESWANAARKGYIIPELVNVNDALASTYLEDHFGYSSYRP